MFCVHRKDTKLFLFNLSFLVHRYIEKLKKRKCKETVSAKQAERGKCGIIHL